MKSFGKLGMIIGIFGIGDLIIKIGHIKELTTENILSVFIFAILY